MFKVSNENSFFSLPVDLRLCLLFVKNEKEHNTECFKSFLREEG